MENKKQNWVLKGFSICTIAYASLSYLEHDCEIAKLIKATDKQTEIPINNDLGCDHKAFVFGANTITPSGDSIVGLTNTATLSGDFIGCSLDACING